MGAVIAFYLLLLWFSSKIMIDCYPYPSTFKASNCEKIFVVNILPSGPTCRCYCSSATPVTGILIN